MFKVHLTDMIGFIKYNEPGLDRFSGYSVFSLDRFTGYPVFSLNWYPCITFKSNSKVLMILPLNLHFRLKNKRTAMDCGFVEV